MYIKGIILNMINKCSILKEVHHFPSSILNKDKKIHNEKQEVNLTPTQKPPVFHLRDLITGKVFQKPLHYYRFLNTFYNTELDTSSLTASDI